MRAFSFRRLASIISKEFVQMRRDRLTFAMMIVIPVVQLILFGYAINSNPKHLHTVIINGDISPMTRSFVAALQNSNYFQIVDPNANEQEAARRLQVGDIKFIIKIPPNFTHDLIRGKKPNILVTADATDPILTANSISSIRQMTAHALDLDFDHGLSYLKGTKPSFDVIVHSEYNPEIINDYYTVPGLMGTILTMTMVMITSLAITREFERGTMETLLAMPVKPIEVLLGKITPYILVGYTQQLIVIMAGILLFNVPFEGSYFLLIFATLFFITANLSVGITFSTLARNQLQAMQMAFFFFLPSMLLSGFMFPVQGMPHWAQMIAETLPLKHFLVIVRGILLKGNTFPLIWPEIWPILLFMLGALTIALIRYRRTLD